MLLVTKKRMKELLDAEATLAALQSGGVDNWEWYDASLEEYKGIPDDHPELLGEQPTANMVVHPTPAPNPPVDPVPPPPGGPTE